MSIWQKIRQWRAKRPPDDVLLNLFELLFWIGIFGVAGGLILLFG